jgi:hypothetical protein
VELSARWEVDAELEALWASAVRVLDLVLGGADGPSSLAAFVSTTVEVLKDRIHAVTVNGVPFCISCCRVKFPIAEDQYGGARVWTQRGPNRG